MRPASMLIVYGTSYGQTAKIAARMTEHLRASGALVELVDSDHVPRDLNVRDFDGNPKRITEADALIAYLQTLGTFVDFRLYDDKANIR